MKFYTKVFALLFVMVFLLTACGQSDKPVSHSGFQEEIDETDFAGEKFQVCGDIDEKSKTLLSFNKERVLADTIRSRFKEVEEKYNCQLVKAKSISSIEDLFYSTITGKNPVDFFVEFIFYGGDEFKNGLLTPMGDVSDYIDLTDSFRWGNPNNLEIFARDGELYGVYPASWPETGIMSTDFLLVYNAELMVNELNLEDPRQYYEKKQWTPDRFVEYVKDSTIQRGGDEKPIYGLSANARHLLDISLKAYDAYPAHRDANGLWVAGYKTEAGAKALTFMSRFLSSGDLNSFVINQAVSGSVGLWADKGCSMCLLHSNYTFSQAGSDSSNLVTSCGIEYGLMPFPTESGKLVAQYERCVNAIAIPALALNPSISAILINDLFAPLPEYDTEEALIEYYTNNVVFDRRDAELLINLTKNSRYLFHDEDFSTLHSDIVTLLESNSPAAALEKSNNRVVKFTEQSVIPAYEAIEEIFGIQY